MSRFLLLSLVFAASPIPGQCNDAPTVQVTTAPIVKSVLGHTVIAYGTVDAGPDRMSAISLPYASQIIRLAATAGKRVKRNDVLLTVKPDPTVALAFKQAETARTLAKSEVLRIQQLFEEHLATNSQLATARKTLADAEATVQTQGEFGGGEDTVTIRAPFDGTVNTIAAAQGDRVVGGTTILDLAAGNGYVVSLTIEPLDSRAVKPGQPVALTVLEEPSSLSATVDNVGAAIEPKTGMVIATLRLAQAGGLSPMPGEHVRGVIQTDSRETWVVPREAVLSGENGAYIFQVVGGKAKRVVVKTGAESNGVVGVEGGFDAALPVIVQGNYEASDGMQVQTTAQPR